MDSEVYKKACEVASPRGTEPVSRTPGPCAIQIPGPCGLVIFGASGDLTKRKILPSVYRLQKNRLLPEQFFILGTGRTEMSTDQFRGEVLSAVRNAFPKDFDESSWNELANRLDYCPIEYAVQETYAQSLKERLLQLEKKHKTEGNRIFYLAIPPTLYENVISNLGRTGLSREEGGYTHVVIEKPFGRDLDSARKLNRIVRNSFDEKQVYRIDHFLALETIQNILMLRFANSIFEPLWNRNYIDHIQITASETLGVEQRAGYYEQAGVLRDMFQNHMFQLLALTAMEPPVAFRAEPVRDEKVQVFNSIKPFPRDRLRDYVAIGQYGAGKIGLSSVPGYREEKGISAKSVTPTFAAMKVLIDNWRWNGVPFYLRSGKRLSRRRTEISIHFKPVPHLMFSNTLNEPIEPNRLVLRVHPDEGMSLLLQTKNPGSKICLNPISMDFWYQRNVLMDAYEWVLLNCMHDDQLLFVREDGVEQAWALLTPVIERLESTTAVDQFPNYAAGSSGPEDADLLMRREGREWTPL
ncbi:MAG TPA: glucose-6-phosphate dehydrogenase [Thermodesulfobacteriota bacterium]|nr:glucose-6-phosphate dehydrogenase [Thermodesulfobacteriota bacterium]